MNTYPYNSVFECIRQFETMPNLFEIRMKMFAILFYVFKMISVVNRQNHGIFIKTSNKFSNSPH